MSIGTNEFHNSEESYLSQLEDCSEDDLLNQINLNEIEPFDPNDRFGENFNSPQIITPPQSNVTINVEEKDFTPKLEWNCKIVGGLRFRYQSEIDKKSFSTLKSNDGVPSVKILVNEHSHLKLTLLTLDKKFNHFHSFYTDKPNESNFTFLVDNSVLIPIKPNQYYQLVKFQNIGIKKLRQNEAIPVIRKLYPACSEDDAKKVFNQYKDNVVVQAILIPQFMNGETRVVPVIYSDPIKSLTGTENLQIKINYITPVNITTNEENIIAVLQKKVTDSSNVRAYLDGKDIKKENKFLEEKYKDGQTFVYKLPRLCIKEKLKLDFIIRNNECCDKVPVTFIPVEGESRKRKKVIEDNIALKRPNLTPSDSVLVEQTPQTETSENYGDNIQFDSHEPDDYSSDDIEFDEVQQPTTSIPTYRVEELKEVSDSGCGDSMDHQGLFESEDEDKYDEDSESDCDNDNSESETETDDEYEMDGKRRNAKQNNYLEHIEVPLKPREKVILNPKHTEVTIKVLKEISKIGHDLAFGNTTDAIFDRFVNSLPVVFTLQDDVGDTPLNNAILKGNLSAAKIILNVLKKHCNWALNLKNTSNQTALVLAPACDIPVDFVKDLLEAGCSLDEWDDSDKNAIIYAIEYNKMDILDLLLKHCTENGTVTVLRRPHDVHRGALHEAILRNNPIAVKMLLSLKNIEDRYMVDVNEPQYLRDETPLHLAIDNNTDPSIIEYILNRPDLDINKKCSSKETAYDFAIKRNKRNIADKLKQNGGISGDEINENEMEIEDTEEDNRSPLDTRSRSESSSLSPSTVILTPQRNVGTPVSIESSSDVEEKNNKINDITNNLAELSINGNLKMKVLEILINGNLSKQDAMCIVKKPFRHIFSNNKTNSDVPDLLKRFNCLPTSFKELHGSLKNVNRDDLVNQLEKLVIHNARIISKVPH